MMLLFIDSNILLYHLAGDEQYGETVRARLERISRGEEVATSTLILSQVIAYLRWKKKGFVITRFIDFLNSTLTIHKVETIFSDFAAAQKLQAQTKVTWESWDDLTIVVQVSRIGITKIYPNDHDFDTILNIKRTFH